MNTESIYQVKVRANFYGGKYYETSIDSIFVKASSTAEAKRLNRGLLKVVSC